MGFVLVNSYNMRCSGRGPHFWPSSPPKIISFLNLVELMTIYIFSTEHIYFYFIRHAKFGFLELESKENMSLRLPKKKKKKTCHWEFNTLNLTTKINLPRKNRSLAALLP